MTTPKTAAAATSTLGNILSTLTTVISAVAPVASVLAPGYAAAINIGTKIVQGMIAEEPAAVALWDQIVGGTPPTAAQLAAYETAYETAYQQLNMDIAAAIKAGPK